MKRNSNIELLRIVAMIFVLIIHANSFSNGLPGIKDIDAPMASFTRLFVQMSALVAVNVFVLISGWFGIKFTLKGVGSILFQCLFYSVFALISVELLSPNSIDFSLKQLNVVASYWFVPAYLGLMVLAPILNQYVESVDRYTQKKLLLSFFLFQFIFGWAYVDMAHFAHGYSCFSFIGLYLLARYIRKFRSSILNFSAVTNLYIYILLSMFSSLMIFASLYTNEWIVANVTDKMLAYNNPFCIISSLFLLLFFSKIDIGSNRYINWCAKSSFAIYLIHFHVILRPYYKQLMSFLYVNYDGPIVLVYILLSVLIIALLSVFIDKFRIVLWEKILVLVNQ